MRRSASLLAAAGTLTLALLALAGCATPTGAAPGPTDAPADGPDESLITAAWLDDGRSIGLVTLGSSSCVPIAETVEAVADVLTVTLADGDDQRVCTADLAPRATVIGVPDGVDPATDYKIRVTGDGVDGATTLAGVEGLAGPDGETDYQPSAGWTSETGQLVFLTWGSSTCVPVVADATATAAAEVTVTFQTPPEDQMCTMDMAPRGTVVQVEGVESPDGAELVLTGSPEFDDVRVPILGAN